ncbi:RidA family protein [Xanthomonas sp. XNM01]|uniref:RidA family protein n=1 Tax=Xanthomonas sp. XNM01 TaxID=2769289 RepID=UPI001781C371|nr:RidA family protein [Xanthomonas sp. XNM01]MBD9369903.1 RidA family protein [Xanthomonas sp. XNM01]
MSRFLASLLSAVVGTAAAAEPAPSNIQHFRDPASPYPFSAAVRAGDTLYLSGQIGVDAQGRVPEAFEAQARQALDNLVASLEMAGLGLEHVVKCVVMIEDMQRWPEFNRVYLEYFTDRARLPARSAFGSSGLALGAALEVECIAQFPE